MKVARKLLWSMSGLATYILAALGAQEFKTLTGGGDAVLVACVALITLFIFLNRNSN